MNKFIKPRYVAIIVLFALLSIPASYFYRVNKVSTMFWSAEKGEKQIDIETRIGKPDFIGLCGDHLSWGGDQTDPPKNNGECVSWVRYNFFLQAYAFGYSETGKLTSKYRYVSE